MALGNEGVLRSRPCTTRFSLLNNPTENAHRFTCTCTDAHEESAVRAAAHSHARTRGWPSQHGTLHGSMEVKRTRGNRRRGANAHHLNEFLVVDLYTRTCDRRPSTPCATKHQVSGRTNKNIISLDRPLNVTLQICIANRHAARA